ncbi:MAG TPA: RDD family protein [Pyrinomonadaceae bacterium]|nr:RDD family protein [Pyrinomonadaceae bacterium]
MSESILAAEETLIIETPERVELEFSLASIGNRFMAVGIDHFIQFLSIFLVAWIMAWIASGSSSALFEDSPKWVTAIMILVVFVLFASYFAVFEWLWNGQTPGKRLMKLRVIRDDGRPLTLWEAIVRNLLRIADAAPGFVIPIYSVGLITIFLNARDQRLGDIFAGTVVIRERVDEAPTFADTFTKRIADPATTRVQKPVTFTADISKITEDEIEVAEVFLRRRWDLSERQRLWMAWRIALPLMYKLKPRYSETDFTYEGFLEELLARFEARQKFAN